MTRHAKNNTASACYSYHERQKDNKKGGYGTQRARLAKDSVKDFDACSLTMHPCRRPVITPDGYLFDKEAILEYIVHQKMEIARKVKEYEKQKRREEKEEDNQESERKRLKAESFEKLEKSLINAKFLSNEASTSKEETKSVSNMSGTKDKTLPSFWVPTMTPQAVKEKIEKPDTNVYCPFSGKPLKAKNLIEIHFTPIDKSSSSSVITKKERYMCPVTHDALGNSVPCAVLRTSGSVVTMECVEKILKKEMIDPINGKEMSENDIIPLQRGGTGFASTNQLKAELKKPVMQA